MSKATRATCASLGYSAVKAEPDYVNLLEDYPLVKGSASASPRFWDRRGPNNAARWAGRSVLRALRKRVLGFALRDLLDFETDRPAVFAIVEFKEEPRVRG